MRSEERSRQWLLAAFGWDCLHRRKGRTWTAPSQARHIGRARSIGLTADSFQIPLAVSSRQTGWIRDAMGNPDDGVVMTSQHTERGAQGHFPDSDGSVGVAADEPRTVGTECHIVGTRATLKEVDGRQSSCWSSISAVAILAGVADSRQFLINPHRFFVPKLRVGMLSAMLRVV
jgi:hypothetical protein